MNNPHSIRRLYLRLGFIVLVMGIIMFRLLPQQIMPDTWGGPDWIMLFVFAWSARQPDLLPLVMLAILLFVADLLLARPPGLWALLVLLAAERLKIRVMALRDSTLFAELLEVWGLIIGISALYYMMLRLFGIDDISLWLVCSQTLFSIIAYPFAILITHTFMSVRKRVPGELERTGSAR